MSKFHKMLMSLTMGLVLFAGYSLRTSSDSGLDGRLKAVEELKETVFTTEPVYEYVASNWITVGSVEVSEDFTDVGRLLIRNITGEDLFTRVEFGTVEYSINSGWDEEVLVIPLTMGSGVYTVTIGPYAGEHKWYPRDSFEVEVKYKDSLSPFIGPSYFNYFDSESLSGILAKGIYSNSDNVINSVEEFVMSSLVYYRDYVVVYESQTVPSDEVLSDGYGVCADYAVVITTMLRSLGIPCKTVWGYTHQGYHAWNMYYNGVSWVRIDATWSDSGTDDSIIADDSNYEDYKYF